MVARIMGILNVTPDSFSDGGEWFELDAAVDARRASWSPRAPTILDVGGESTRPRAEPVAVDEELRRVVPVVRRARAAPACRSASTRRSSTVAEAAVDAGATFVNDVTAFRHDPELAGLVAERGCDCCLMHMLGEPRTMQDDPRYDDVVDDVKAFLEERVDVRGRARACARSASSSTRASASARRSSTTSSCCGAWTGSSRSGFPVVIGTSRKSFLGRLTGRDDPHERVAGDRSPRTCWRSSAGRACSASTTSRPATATAPGGGDCYVARRWRLSDDDLDDDLELDDEDDDDDDDEDGGARRPR